MPVELAYKAFGKGPPLIILHGLFGSKRNWASIAKALSAHFHVFCLDLRNHGESPWADGMDYATMAADVHGFIKRHALAGATVIGHSMGGKTAMALSLLHGEALNALVVVDIAPVAHSGADIRSYLETLMEVPLAAFRDRAEVEDHLSESITEAGIRSFLLQNLVRSGERLQWRINLAAIADDMDSITGFIDTGHGRSYGGPTLFVAGGNSNYVQPRDHTVVGTLFPKARIEIIAGAGHWLHAEQPGPFLDLLKQFLDDVG
ncbi:MAG: alpha/beta fold hydrolase [Rhodospirillaceae bacterium]|nr:alpha/beta fold hydrolase [Rhodospirillaceae bacterium]MBL6931259.1 alpha/beta fold hydrolase [Rhodospirillales bacterium]